MKSNLCKHIHLVVLFERQRGDFVLGHAALEKNPPEDVESQNQIFFEEEEPSQKRVKFQEEVKSFVEEKKMEQLNVDTDSIEREVSFNNIFIYVTL